ncbi:hypothetical protein [Pseudomonas sp.]|uniref:hypothetical protein n=1 Tax=Pseudomonas sp. TaxID=306 RepID=UPI0031DA6645
MTFKENFSHVRRQSLEYKQTLHMPTGLSIRSNSTSCTGFHEAFKGPEGTELVIGELCDVEIAFRQEVESLLIEYYVVSDQHFEEVQLLLDTDGCDMDLISPVPRHFYWLTLSGSGYTDYRRGPVSSQPYQQIIEGPFRRLTISTSLAGTVNIRRLEWTRTYRH